ncbi:MAG: hypothetical protein WA071_28085 [Undibacterium umbellatum]|uniref:hypothetical protein n=1 Tax=Undibacterium umbellatum TaxID=2762300 RepID=UPI003BB7358F
MTSSKMRKASHENRLPASRWHDQIIFGFGNKFGAVGFVFEGAVASLLAGSCCSLLPWTSTVWFCHA